MRRSTTFKRTCNTASLSEGVRLGHKIKAERTRIETMTKRPGADAGENSANWRSRGAPGAPAYPAQTVFAAPVHSYVPTRATLARGVRQGRRRTPRTG